MHSAGAFVAFYESIYHARVDLLFICILLTSLLDKTESRRDCKSNMSTINEILNDKTLGTWKFLYNLM